MGLIQDVEIEYSSTLLDAAEGLARALGRIAGAGPLPINGTEVSRAILRRMATYYEVQNRTKRLLDRKYVAAGTDTFVETALFYLKAFLSTHQLDASVHSERAIARKRGAARPDISVWRGTHLVAAIECKTQLGRSRHRWEAGFHSREQELKADNLVIGIRAYQGGNLNVVPDLASEIKVFPERFSSQQRSKQRDVHLDDIDKLDAVRLVHGKCDYVLCLFDAVNWLAGTDLNEETTR